MVSAAQAGYSPLLRSLAVGWRCRPGARTRGSRGEVPRWAVRWAMVVRGVRVKRPGRRESGLKGAREVACAGKTSWR